MVPFSPSMDGGINCTFHETFSYRIFGCNMEGSNGCRALYEEDQSRFCNLTTEILRFQQGCRTALEHHGFIRTLILPILDHTSLYTKHGAIRAGRGSEHGQRTQYMLTTSGSARFLLILLIHGISNSSWITPG